MRTYDSPPVDVVVVGAGLAGLAAANRALEHGLSVVVLERQAERDHVCASRANGGVFHVGFRSVTADRDELFAVIRTANDGFGDIDVARTLADNALRSIEWLERSGVPFTKLEPDHGWKDKVLAPVGFHDRTTMAWRGLGADRLINELADRVVRGGGEIRRGLRAERLIEERGRVVGLVARDATRSDTIAARHVVLADGGFEGDHDLVREHITPHPEHLLLRGCESGLGDGIRMARDVGAELVGMHAFYGHILSADSLQREGLSPFPFLEFLASAGMLVDARGERFVDETAGGHYTSNALARRGNGLGFVIFDRAMWEGIGRHFFCPPNPNLVEAGGTLHRAETLQALAHGIGIDANRLAEHAAQIDAEVRARRDNAAQGEARERMTAYAKGKHPHERFATPPFYAAPACAALTSTLGGVRIDGRARVVDANRVPIAGLYAAGSVTGGVEGGPAVGYIGGLIKALVFGLVAAEDIARATSVPH